jgi:hypothetical protein
MVQPYDPREMDKTQSQPQLVNESSLLSSIKCFVSKHYMGLLVLLFILWLVFFGGGQVIRNVTSSISSYGTSLMPLQGGGFPPTPSIMSDLRMSNW